MTKTLFVSGSIISSAEDLPRICSPIVSIISEPSTIVFLIIPSFVPQSYSVIITSCATSTNLLVKYPELAVFNAVSASPFLAPCVELKYSKTDKPSLKLEIIGVSIISPEGLAIKPLIAANCFI